MADYKDYIVRYDIQADVTKAAEGLRAIADIAKQFEGPMQTLAESITRVSQAAYNLKQNSQIKFAPQIDLSTFNNQLRKMVVDVRAAASEMHSALFQALSGNPVAGNAMKKGAASALSSPKNIAQIKRDIESYERELDKIYGTRKKNKRGETIRNRDGSLFYAKKSNMHDRVAELEGQGKAIRARISQLKTDMAALEKLEKDAVAATSKATKKTAVTTKPQAAPITNVTPAVIRQWKEAFGDARLKNLTINIKGNANGPKGAITVIEQVLTSLKTLQSQASFTINPLLNPEGFAAAESKLRSLAALSSKVVAPFGGQTGKGTTSKRKGKGGKTGATGAKPLVVDVVGNITSVLPPKTELEVPVVGEMVKLQSKASEAIPVNAKISAGSITESLKGKNRPTVPVNIKLMWEKGAISRQAQLKNISEKMPPIKLVLDTTAAIAKLEEFVVLVKSSSPQNIALTASGGTKTGNTATGTGKGTKGHQAAVSTLTPREYRDAVGRHLAQGFSLPSGYATQISDQQRMRAWQLDNMRRGAISAFANPTPYEQKLVREQEKAAARAQKESVRQSIARHQQQANRLRAQAQNAMLPFAQSKEQLNMLTKNRRYFRQAVATTGIMPTAGMEAPQMLRYLQGVSDQMRQASVPIPWQLQSQINKLKAETGNAGGANRTSSRSMVPMPMQQKPFFDRARKWAYPFTGQTSFGARTPMAVDMAKGMGVMFAIGGAMSAIGSSFSQAMEYQNTMRTTQAILQNGTESYSQSAFRNMEATVRNVGVKTKFSAPEVANAARFLAMAGYDIDAINASIRPIADLALIGDSDLGETADKMTNIMTTFGIKPGQMRGAANIMATTATRSNTDLMMLAESAKYGGGVAQMYGRNDPNLFADTMALFGVMGNAGIQASSAGTALRMMYQNVFKPNKNQKKVLEMMKSTYKISTLNEDGSYRAMSSILTEMAQRIPENEMAEIVGNLFRITAQPGAAAALLAAAGGDHTAAQEIGAGIEVMSSKMSSKAGLSSLVSLMLANRESINGNISGAIAEEKQNTITGLLAQVTSTFTEGIVQAFEQRQGGFEGMLKGLRDYLAKPETIAMLQNLLDMVIEIGKVMAWFVKIWADLYNMCPGLIKFWVTAQMAFTQVGTLIAPIVALIGVFNRLGKVIAWLSGISSTGVVATSRMATGAAGVASASALNAPFIVGTTNKGRPISIRGNAAARANRAIASNAILAGELALSGADLAATRASLDNGTRQHYAAVQARAKRMYGWSRVGRAFRGGMSATLSAASLAPMFGGISKLFMGLMTGLAKAVGLLCNPITLAIAAAGGLAYGIYKLKQRMDGATEAQIESRKRAEKAVNQTADSLYKNSEWHTELLREDMPAPIKVISSAQPEKVRQFEERRSKFMNDFKILFTDFDKGASQQSLDIVADKWREIINRKPNYRLALGNRLAYYTDHLTTWTGKYDKFDLSKADPDDFVGQWLTNKYYKHEGHAKELQENMMRSALMMEGANHPEVQKGVRELVELQKKVLTKAVNPETGQPYDAAYIAAESAKIRERIAAQFPVTRSANELNILKYRQTDDRSIYDAYQQGALNLIDAYIEGLNGTKTGLMESQEALQGKIGVFSEAWYNAIAAVASGYTLFDEFVSSDGKQRANVNLMLNILPNGQIDFSSLEHQIMEKVGAFKLNLQKFTDIAATFYNSLGTILNEGELYRVLHGQVQHKHIDEQTARQYYREHIANNVNNRWYKAGFTEQSYVDFVTSTDGSKKANFDNGTSSTPGQERVQMRKTIAGDSARAIAKANKEQSSKDTSSTTPANPKTPTTPTVSPSPITMGSGSQDVYASHYDKSAARPTVVNINIGEMAHFDRTAITSSSQERDLMAAMEEKITEAVYRLSMAAFNNVSGYMA